MFCVRARDNDSFHNSLHHSVSIDTNGQSARRASVPQVSTASRTSYVSIVTLRIAKEDN
ncbi:hypothetical protein DY000_02063462 [Brassica cretica]|uniref:Uncharacterized protein n=1 Tax=Brassica cretica TaxID=69181 RepID=A0ABQ7AZL6_BRACR|nr:hypothetical protein DY000_02063462 [Brassica cretica]